MSSKAVGWALEQQVGDPVAKLVLVAVAEHANPRTGVCWPSRATVALLAECDTRTITRKVGVLARSGLLVEVNVADLDDEERARFQSLPKDKRPRLWLVPAGHPVEPRVDAAVQGRGDASVLSSVDAPVDPRVDTDGRAGGQAGGQAVHQTKRKPLDKTAGAVSERRDYLDAEETRELLDDAAAITADYRSNLAHINELRERGAS